MSDTVIATRKVKIREVRVERIEGPVRSSPSVVTGTSLSSVSSRVADWALTAPKAVDGYDKCHIRVEWEDGRVYETRYDLTRDEGVDLASHVRGDIAYFAGLRRPLRLTDEQYAMVVRRNSSPARQALLRDLFESYEIE